MTERCLFFGSVSILQNKNSLFPLGPNNFLATSSWPNIGTMYVSSFGTCLDSNRKVYGYSHKIYVTYTRPVINYMLGPVMKVQKWVRLWRQMNTFFSSSIMYGSFCHYEIYVPGGSFQVSTRLIFPCSVTEVHGVFWNRVITL